MNKRLLFIFLICLIASFCYSYFFHGLYNDEIWNYGFAYNISSGLIPYRDFNMIVTPFYSILLSLFIIIFGNHLYVMHLLNAILLSIIVCLLYVKLGKKVLLLIPFLFMYSYPGYNFFCLFMLFVIIFICDNDNVYMDILLCFLVSIVFLTKQTIGLFLLIPTIYYSRNKTKGIISFIIPIVMFVIYLLWNNALYEFIDYCFLGLFDFGSKNRIMFFLPMEIVIIIVLFYWLIKSNFSRRDIFYVLCFQIVVFPILDDYHFMIGFIPFLYLFLKCINIIDFHFKYYLIIVYFACFYSCLLFNQYDNYHLYSDKSSYLYGRYIERFIEDDVTFLSSYLENIKNDYDYVFLFTQNSYMIKLNTSYSINEFDLINEGNMGFNGVDKYISKIDRICSKNSCLFFTYLYEFGSDGKNGGGQTSKELLEYVCNKYNNISYLENIGFELYSNK